MSESSFARISATLETLVRMKSTRLSMLYPTKYAVARSVVSMGSTMPANPTQKEMTARPREISFTWIQWSHPSMAIPLFSFYSLPWSPLRAPTRRWMRKPTARARAQAMKGQ